MKGLEAALTCVGEDHYILYINYIIYIRYYTLKSERPGGGTDLCGGGSLLHPWEDSAQQGEVKNGFV